ncbi:MAG: hypothetical protein J5805_01170 [Bacteroidaceae bacterium]|nr:hypothetical protein [Bacteroidaceae bacterium]
MKKRKLLILALLLSAASAHSQILPFSEEELTVARQHQQELSLLTHFSAHDAFAQLKLDYSVWHEHSNYLLNLFQEREFRKHICDFIENDAMKRVGMKQSIDSLYQDSIDVRLLPFNDKLAGAAIQHSLHMLFVRKQTATPQYKAIESIGLKVAKRLRKNPFYNYKKEVMGCLKKNLTSSQLNSVLTTKNLTAAINKTDELMRKLQSAGMISQIDSTSEKEKAAAYYISEMNIYDMYEDNEQILKNNLRELWKQQPQSVRMAESLNQKAILQKKKEERTINENLVW